MAEERQDQGQGEGRRRYFRRRQRAGKSSQGNTRETGPGEIAPKAGKTRSEKVTTAEKEARTPVISRRRRRARAKSMPSVIPRTETPDESIVNLDDYVPPASVFIYSYTLRPDARDSYEFRAEHFSKVGRRLEDYHIDISSLFPEDVAAEAPARRIDAALFDVDTDGEDE